VTAPWRRSGSRGFTLLAAAALATVLAGTALIGGLPQADQTVAPTPPPSVQVSASAEPSATAAPGRIVYTRHVRLANGEGDCVTRFQFCHRASVFVSNADGTAERELFPGLNSRVVAASADGSKLLVSIQEADVARLYMTDVDGADRRLLDIECQFPCVHDWSFAISPDGGRLAFARTLADNPETEEATGSVIAIMDLATGRVVQLASTFASNPELGDPCHQNCGEGDNAEPSWSSDGEHLLFSRTGIGTPNQPRMWWLLDSVLFRVDADGANLQQLTPTEVRARDGHWSPDGSLIVFTSTIESVAGPPEINALQQRNDLYTVRPDGTGLERLTTDTVGPLKTLDPVEVGARFASWTRDGRIVFTRNAEPGEEMWQLWVMDRDGSNVTRLEPSDPVELTAIGCASCPYPGLSGVVDYPSVAFWTEAR
jgi:Tol biopolymer transport system component